MAFVVSRRDGTMKFIFPRHTDRQTESAYFWVVLIYTTCR